MTDIDLLKTAHPDAAILDTRGLKCPLPVIKMETALRKIGDKETLIILADDPIAFIDIPHFCAEGGHLAKRLADIGPACVFLVTASAKTDQ